MKRMILCAVLVLTLLTIGIKAVSAEQVEGPPTVAYVVKPGDNLWRIARRVDPSGDNRRTVQTIIDLNGLSGGGVVAGQPLRLPAP